MKHRQCDTTKYRQRRRREKENRLVRQQREELMKARYEEIRSRLGPVPSSPPPPPIISQAIATEDYGEWLRELRNLLRVLRARVGLTDTKGGGTWRAQNRKIARPYFAPSQPSLSGPKWGRLFY